jgi:hypothetical protein
MSLIKKEKILLTATYAAGILAAAVFIITKTESLMYAATQHMFDDGDLYRFAKVLDFKTPIPPIEEILPDEMELDEHDIFMVGDSFLDESRGYAPLWKQISQRMNTTVHPQESGNTPEDFNLLYYCKANGISKRVKRKIILERVERYIVSDFAEEFDDNPKIEASAPASEFSTFVDEITSRWFTNTEYNYEVFFSSSNVMTPLVELWNTAKFHLLNSISDKTPTYALAPPFLFYHEETARGSVTSFYYPHTDTLINAIADNIEMLNNGLFERCNLELVFMPVPNSYTLYHKFVNDDAYDNFLPRLCNEVERRGVKTIRLYERFAASNDILYFPTDSHWNERGLKIAVDEAVKVLSAME